MDDFQALIAKMDALKGDVLQTAQRKALRKVGELVQTAIEERAPERTDDLPDGNALAPGALKADIKVRVHVATDEGTVSGDNSRVTIGPGPKTRHVASWIENGHAIPKAKNGAQSVPARPFLRPAADAVEQQAIDTYTESMTADITAAME